MMLKNSSQNCIGAPPAPLGGGTPCYCLAKSLRLRFAQICFAPGLNRRRDGILLAHRNFLAALDQFIRALAKFASLLLRVIFAFISLLCKVVASILAGFWREENPYQRSNSQPYEEIRHLGSYVVRHSNLHRNRSIATSRGAMRPNLYPAPKLVILLKHSPDARGFSPHFSALRAGSICPLLPAEDWQHFQIPSAAFARSLTPRPEYPQALSPSDACRAAAGGR